ncbi:MAG: glycosyltransferase family 4 protein [Puia sp.]|nr:glycosyltransferase family 4 protein [Puia sp.]
MAFVSTIGFPWGGCELLWTAAAKEALLQGHEVLVSVFDWPQQHPKIEELKTLGATLHYRRRFFPSLPERVRKKIMNRLLPSGRKATYHDYLLQFKADRILFNLAGGDEIARSDDDLMVFIRQSEIPFFVAYHSLSDRPQFDSRTIENYIFQVNKARVNLFTSRLQLDLLQHQIASKIPRASVIDHPLNISKGAIPDYPSGEPVNFAVVGSLVCRWKGQDLLMRILSGPQWEARPWKLNIYGEGEDRQYLESLASYYGIRQRVFFHGYENDPGRIWQHNHVLLAPSRQDSGPIVCFEAMYFARPVVGSRMGAMPQYITDGETGVLSAGISEKDYEEALEKAWGNRDHWKEWGENGKKRLEREYNFAAGETLLALLVQ